MKPVVWLPKLWRLPYLVSKVSNYVFNIFIVTHINLYFIFLIITMDQMSSGLHGVEIELNTTQKQIAYNVINMQTMPEFSTEDGQFCLLSILYLVLLSAGKYRFRQLYHLPPLKEKLYACTKLLRKIKLSGDMWKLQHSAQMHLHYIGKIKKSYLCC